MNILHINCNYVGTALHRIMVQQLNDENNNITVFAPLKKGEQTAYFNASNKEVLCNCFTKWDRLFYFRKQRKIAKALEERITKIDGFDVIHAFTLLTDGGIAYKLSLKYGLPYIVAIRDTDVNDFFRLKPYLIGYGVKIMERASKICFLSNAYRDSVIEKYVPSSKREEFRKKAVVIPNGIDDYWIENCYTDKDYCNIERRIGERRISVVCVGRINKRKNIPTVQKAINILRQKGWTVSFSIIGKIEDRLEMDKIASDKNTKYFPPTDKSGLISHYRSADVFALASHTETFGLVYAEAMSQALPVIYTRGQGFDGQFSDGEVGYAVSDNDPGEIAEKIERICSNYTSISKSAAKNVYKFKWNDICEEYRSIYKDMALVKK